VVAKRPVVVVAVEEYVDSVSGLAAAAEDELEQLAQPVEPALPGNSD